MPMSNTNADTEPWLAAAAVADTLPVDTRTPAESTAAVASEDTLTTRGGFAVPTPPTVETTVQVQGFEDAVKLTLETDTGYVTALLSPADVTRLVQRLETAAATPEETAHHSAVPTSWPAGEP